jgi:hypothetical protein
MAYRRKQSRAPRHVEETEAMRERDQLRESLDALVLRNHHLLLQIGQLTEVVKIKNLEVTKLLHDKIAIGVELRDARTIIDFLEGRMSLGWQRCVRTKY